MEKFLIIDGNSLAFRAYYALPFLTNSQGQPTGAVFGFMNMFLKVIEDCKPSHVVIAFDFSRKTFRNQIYEAYKGTRGETPEDLRSQFPILKSLLKTMGLTVIEQEGIEADDIIGTFAKNAHCSQKIVLSGDRDLLQLIDNQTQVWLTHKGITEIHKIDEEVLLRDYGVLPHQVPDLKGLMGDTSDNIPGVVGIGPKTATNLIAEFGSVENLYQNLETAKLSPKLREKLQIGKENAYMSKILATIKTDCELNLCLENYVLKTPFPVEVTEIIKELDMTSLLKRKDFFVNDEETEAMIILEPKTINSLSELEEVCSKQYLQIAFNLSNDLSFSFGENFVYNIESEITLFSQPPETKDCVNILKKFLEDENVVKIFANYKQQRHNLEKYGVTIRGEVFDINLANYLLGNKLIEENQVQTFFTEKTKLEKELTRQNLNKIYYEMELPLEDVLFDMEKTGFKVDKSALYQFGQKLDDCLRKLTSKIFYMSGEDNFNINSPKQLAKILFDKLGLPETANRSTAVDALLQIQDSHPIIDTIIEYRKIQKLKSTYIDAFLNILNMTGSDLIHTIFNQTLASTGRLSSSEPNLQNLPVRDSKGKELRKAFVSRFAGGQLVSADYNQIELRLLAHLSQDQSMLLAFNSNQDVHTQTASAIFGLKECDVTPEIRRKAKAVNFGIIYGISNVGLAQNTGLTRKEAQSYIDKYFEVYPAVKAYMDKNVEDAKRQGYAKTIFGRRRRIPELRSDNHQTRQFGARVAKNMPLQGSASDIIKFAMLKVAKKLKENNLKSKLILQIHDELVVDCPQDEVEIVKNLLKNSMENVVNLTVKLPVEVTNGTTYYDV